MLHVFCNKVPKKLYLLPSFRALQAVLGLNTACLPVLLFSFSQELEGLKNRWMESKLGWGSLCVIECQEASWLALTVSCTLRKGH